MSALVQIAKSFVETKHTARGRVWHVSSGGRPTGTRRPYHGEQTFLFFSFLFFFRRDKPYDVGRDDDPVGTHALMIA